MVIFCLLTPIILGCMSCLCTAAPKRRPEIPVIMVNWSEEVEMYRNDSPVYTVHLKRPKKLKFICVASDGGASGEFTMYPSDPMSKTLMPLEGDDIEKAITREVPLHSIVRTSELKMQVSKNRNGPAVLRMKNDLNTVIMAKDPENFSLNYACKFQPKDKRKPAIYRWLKVTFDQVYPMAFGCESGDDLLFMNSMPRDKKKNQGGKSPDCRLTAEPGMLVGMHCQDGERMTPEICVSDEVFKALDGAFSPFIPSWPAMPKTRGYRLPSRFRLYKVESNAGDKNFRLVCHCTSGDVIKKTMVIQNVTRSQSDLKALLGSPSLHPEPYFTLMNDLVPGLTMKLIVPSAGIIDLGNFGRVSAVLLPKDPEYNAFHVRGHNDAVNLEIKQLFGAKGVDISYDRNKNHNTYTFDYKKDAVTVVKGNVPFMYHKWDISPINNRKGGQTTLSLMYNLIPTDPYTYGCGVDSEDLFHSSGFQLSTGYENDGVTKCKVNPHLTSPVGFYCPEGFILEPANCFEYMTHKRGNKVVPLSHYAPHARVTEGPHIKVADFHVPIIMKHTIKYGDHELMCKCMDQDGKLRATITLDLRNPSDSYVEAEYPELNA